MNFSDRPEEFVASHVRFYMKKAKIYSYVKRSRFEVGSSPASLGPRIEGKAHIDRLARHRRHRSSDPSGSPGDGKFFCQAAAASCLKNGWTSFGPS